MKVLRSFAGVLVSSLVFTVTASYAQSVPPPPAQTASGVWSDGGAHVDAATGAAVMDYPFALPRARGFVQPTLGLHYRSTGGPSEVGEGWSLGLPEITRRGVSGGPPRFDGNSPLNTTDHIELSGQRLVRCSNTVFVTCDGDQPPPWLSSWAQTGWVQFRGNVERQRTVVYWNLANTFRLQLADGGFAEFGTAQVAPDGDPWSAIDARGAQTAGEGYRWKLVRLVDVGTVNAWKNVTVFRWQHMDGARDVSVLTDVYYTPSSTSSDTNFDRYAHHVRLHYEKWQTAAHPTDPPIWLRRHDWRLRTVAIASRGTNATAPRERVRVYRLTYRDATRSIRGRPFLESIRLEGRCPGPLPEEPDDRGRYSLPDAPCDVGQPPTVFDYTPELGRFNATTQVLEGEIAQSIRFAPPDPNQPLPSPLHSQQQLNDRQVVLVDVNRDGLPDVVSPAGFVFLNPGNGVEQLRVFQGRPLTNLANTFHPNAVAVGGDWDPRALTTGFLFRSETTAPSVFPGVFRRIEPNGPDAFRVTEVLSGFAPGAAVANPHVFGDFDADGTVDALYVDPGATSANSDDTVRLALSKRQESDATRGRFQVTSPTRLFLQTGTAAPRFWRLADMDGDGTLDYVTTREPQLQLSRLAYLPGKYDTGLLNYGFGCDPAATICAAATASAGFNPNAPANALREVHVDNSPTIFQYPSVTDDKILIHDVTGDGRADVLSLHDSSDRITIALYINLDGKTLLSPPPVVTIFKDNDDVRAEAAQFADMNGNGVDDLVLFGLDEAVYVDFQGNRQRPGLLTAVDHASGARTTFTYELLKDHEREQTSVTWARHAPVAQMVVTNVRTQSGAPGVYGRTDEQNFTYRDPIYDRWRNQLVGFEWTSVASGNRTVETQYSVGGCFPADAGTVSPACANPERDDLTSLVGLPLIVDVREATGSARRSTTTFAYDRVAVTPQGLPEGRYVNVVYTSEVNTFLYDDDFVAAPSTVALTLLSSSGRPEGNPVDVRLYGSAVRLRQTQSLDGRWRVLQQTDHGEVNVTSAAAIDRPIVTTNAWVYNTGAGGWRPSSTTVAYGTGGTAPMIADSGLTRVINFTQDSLGRPASAYGTVSGALALNRFHESGLAIALDLGAGNASWSRSLQFNDYNEPIQIRGAAGECTRIAYSDPTRPNDYFDSPSNVFVSTVASPACSTTGELETRTEFDRGLGAVTNNVSPIDGESRFTYDVRGRLVGVARTPATGGPPVAAVELSFIDQSTYTDSQSRVHKMRVRRIGDATTPDHVSWQFVSSVGQPIASFQQADPSAGDGGNWIVHRAPAVPDNSPNPGTWYRPEFYTGNVENFPVASAGEIARWAEQDFTGQITNVNRWDGNTVLRRKRTGLVERLWDAENLVWGSPHENMTTTRRVDGHGRVTRVEKMTTFGLVTTRSDYQATGEATAIERTFIDPNAGARRYFRWFRYDNLGRLVENAEPNTTGAFTENPAAAGSMKAWRYAYDVSGRLVGTRDARGCGKNLYYDAAGRPVAEDYSPCIGGQNAYNAPNISTGDGTEVFYRYDAPEAGQTTDYGPNPAVLRGKLVSIRDRGAHTRFAYDYRGRSIGAAKRIAKPGVVAPFLSSRYATHWFHTATEYDALDRAKKVSTGAESPELLEGGESYASFGYTARGLPSFVAGTYGPLLGAVIADADGFTREMRYGDNAAIATFTPDWQRRLQRYQLSRAAQAGWSNSAYVPPTNPTDLLMAHQLSLADTTFGYDDVGNVTAMADGRNPQLWPDGFKPRSTQMTYDSSYRLASVNYGVTDQQVSPFAAEEAAGDAHPFPRAQTPWRTVSQSFTYDGLGNITQSQDDGSYVFDRSLGSVTHGYANQKPAQLFSTSGAGGMGADAYYDAAGNLVGLDVDRSTTCSQPTGKCSQRFLYFWNEVGELTNVRRWDFTSLSGVSPYPAIPMGTPSAELTYEYSQGQRVWRRSHDPSSAARYTVDVFSSLRLTEAQYLAATQDFEQTAATETLFVGGAARVFYAPGLPSMGSNRHVLLQVGDRLGSANFIIDQATGDVVEHVTHHAYGAVETDYRSQHWQSFREDLRFTGKEEDIELGLTYFGARYYSPNLGRFISPDPLTVHAVAGDINPYAYVNGRVFNMVDPLGLEGCDPTTGLCGGAGAGADMGHPGAGNPLEALGRWLGGGGGGNNSRPWSSAQSGCVGSDCRRPSIEFMPTPYSLPPNIASGVVQQTGVGRFANAFLNPVQNAGEYFAGIGKGVALGACFWCVLGGSSAGYVPDEFYLFGATEDAQRGVADGFGLVAAASGVGEFLMGGAAVGSSVAVDGIGSGEAAMASRINPTGCGTNCVNAAIALDRTLAGSPASALPSAAVPEGQALSVIESAIGRRLPTMDVSGRGALTAILRSMGEGSRAIVYGTRADGSGHALNAAFMNGRLILLDGQAGTSGTLRGLQNLRVIVTTF